jgi:hypothetical protein
VPGENRNRRNIPQGLEGGIKPWLVSFTAALGRTRWRIASFFTSATCAPLSIFGCGWQKKRSRKNFFHLQAAAFFAGNRLISIHPMQKFGHSAAYLALIFINGHIKPPIGTWILHEN